MSATIDTATRTSDRPFNARSMMVVTGVGIVAFIAMLVLGAYAPDLRSGRNGGAHALSNAATGFSGLVRLASATGRNPVIVRSEQQLKSEDLLVVTPDHGWVNLGPLLEHRGPKVTLIVLPKWNTSPDPQRTGWVTVSGLLPDDDPNRMLYPATPIQVRRAPGHGASLKAVPFGAPPDLRFRAPPVVQSMSGRGLTPIITDPAGTIILAKVGDSQVYVLADPDLLNNHGMANEQQAKAALALLDYLNSTGSTSVLFDVTANGLGHSRSPLKLVFDPPFLAVTLVIFTAMLLAGWQALVRFGPVLPPQRAIAFGKTALVNNSAALIRKARREAQLGARYVEVVQERAISLFGLPMTADPQLLARRLEALNPKRSFSTAARAVRDANNRDELLAAARSLNQWLMEVQG